MKVLGLLLVYFPLVLGIYLTYQFVYKSDKFGSNWIGFLMFTLGLWSASNGAAFQFTNPSFVYISQSLISVSALLFFLFTLEYTIRQPVSDLLIGSLTLIFVLINLSIFITADSIVQTISSTVIYYSYPYELLIQVISSSSLYIFSVGILIREALIDIKKDKLQDIMLLCLGIVSVYFVSHILIGSSTESRFLLVCSLVITLVMIIFILGMRYYELFNLKGISYSNLLTKIQDGYIALDKNQNVIERDYSFSKDINEEKVKDFIYSDNDSDVICVTQDYATDLYYRLDKKSFKYGANSYGTLVLVKDISDIKQKEDNLQLLRQVFSRFLRHNVRNRLTVIDGFIETLSINEDERPALEKIKNSTDELLGNSQKALLISNSTAQDIELQEFSIKDVIERGITDVKTELLQDVRVTVKVNSDKKIQAHPKIASIISNAVENAIQHNPVPVEISVISQYDPNKSELYILIEDNGQGIHENEIETINAESESPLKHGTGIGLWLMKILTKESGGIMNIVSSDYGTEIEYVFKIKND